MELPEPFKTKAAIELREDDTRRAQALEQFRDWISKQDHITDPRGDDNFLLRFLRAKKYSNAEAFKMYEKSIVGGQVYPQWFRNFSLDNSRSKELFDDGFLFPLKERDQNGARVIFARAKQFDTKKFNANDHYHIVARTISSLLEEPETQVAGIVIITDFKDVTFDFIKMFNFDELKPVLQFLQNGVPCRLKKAIWLNFPSFGVALGNMAKSFLSAKLRERVNLCVDESVLAETVDVKILPKEYGGVTPISEMLSSFRSYFESQKEKLRKTDAISIDLNRVVDYKLEPVGSFKKLDID